MATYALVHGTWWGSWCWREVEPYLDTHVQDIVNLLAYEGVRHGVLVG